MEDFSKDTVRLNKASIGQMFDSIAWRYDFLNHFLSFGTDRRWRKKAIQVISKTHPDSRILDVATGTGDLAIAAMELNPTGITGIDISDKMLELGRKKIREKKLSASINLVKSDSENICFDDNTFDVTMVAFGVRNFSDPVKGLSEMNRVLRRGGLIMVLEFSKPDVFLFKQIYNFYFRNLLPFFGRLFSKDRKAYTYLHDSVMRFPDSDEFMMLMKKTGFSATRHTKLTFGVASIYTGIKE